MSIILGFSRKQDLMAELLHELNKVMHLPLGEAEPAAREVCAAFGDGEDVKVCVHNVAFTEIPGMPDCEIEPEYVRVLDGQLMYVQRDHPLSPDGVAGLWLQFCVVTTGGSVWGAKTYTCDTLGTKPPTPTGEHNDPNNPALLSDERLAEYGALATQGCSSGMCKQRKRAGIGGQHTNGPCTCDIKLRVAVNDLLADIAALSAENARLEAERDDWRIAWRKLAVKYRDLVTNVTITAEENKARWKRAAVDLPTTEDLRAAKIDITGGEDAVAYIRRMRDGDPATPNPGPAEVACARPAASQPAGFTPDCVCPTCGSTKPTCCSCPAPKGHFNEQN